MNNTAHFVSVHGPRCPHCKGPMTVHQSISPGHCGKPVCAQAHIARVAQARTEVIKARFEGKRQIIRNRNRHVVGRAAKALGVDQDSLRVEVVPHQNKPLEPLPPDERAGLVAHLETIVDEAFERRDSGTATTLSPVKTLDPSPDEAAVCTACQGSCCFHGRATNAFLTKWVIARLLQEYPEMTREEARDFYLDRLPEVSVRGNCFYQSPTGCTIERERRADICNTFQCSPLHEIAKHVFHNPDTRLVLLAADPDGRVDKVMTWSETSGAQVLRHRKPRAG